MLKLRTLFSGIGSPEKALKNAKIPFELTNFCENDKYAVKSYCAIHGISEDKNLGDITKVWGRDLQYADMMVWGFPCQDISVAGKQRGLKEGETRSGLYYEGLRILKETKPKYSIIENVKNLTGKKFRAEFEQMLKDIEEIGYNNYWQVLNAKNYGIPQNRERVFIVSIRKDVDNGTFEFPKGFDNGLRLKDFLEDEVEEKYYLSEKMIEGFKKHNINHEAKGTGFIWEPTDINKCAKTLRANGALCPTDNTIMQIGMLDIKGNEQVRRVYSDKGCSPALNTCGGENRQPKILKYERTEYGKEIRKQYENGGIKEKIGNMRELSPREDGISNTLTTVLKDNLVLEPKVIAIKEATKQGYAEATIGDSINIQFPNSQTRRGRVGVGVGVAQTLETSCNQATLTNDYRIRKLTPKECFRLMGFDDEDFQKAADSGISNSQLYKQAGNSIVTNVLESIFKILLKEYRED